MHLPIHYCVYNKQIYCLKYNNYIIIDYRGVFPLQLSCSSITHQKTQIPSRYSNIEIKNIRIKSQSFEYVLQSIFAGSVFCVLATWL